jgi:drug/metabolite transporter (DMT)-like permease
MIPFYFERIARVFIPWTIKIFLVLSLLIHAIGEFHRYYYLIPNFDSIAHLTSSIAIASLICLVILCVLLYYGLEWRRSKIVFIIIFMTVIFGVFYEWFEIFSYTYFGSQFSWELRDSTADIMVDSIGAILVAWHTNNYLKERTMRTVASDFVVPEIDGHYKSQWAILPESATSRSDASSSSKGCHSTEDLNEGR